MKNEENFEISMLYYFYAKREMLECLRLSFCTSLDESCREESRLLSFEGVWCMKMVKWTRVLQILVFTIICCFDVDVVFKFWIHKSRRLFSFTELTFYLMCVSNLWLLNLKMSCLPYPSSLLCTWDFVSIVSIFIICTQSF